MFGEIGGRIVSAMICIGLISSISAMMWIGPRVMMTMGEDIPALRVFARKSANGAPAYAILFQLAVAGLLLFTRSFEAVLDFIQFGLLFCSFFTVARRRQAADHAARSAAALSCLGIPDYAGGFPARDRLHDVLSFGRTTVAVVAWCPHHDFGPFDLRRFPQAAGPACRSCIAKPKTRPRITMLSIRMLQLKNIAAVVVVLAARRGSACARR